jgi:hypothetical protein
MKIQLNSSLRYIVAGILCACAVFFVSLSTVFADTQQTNTTIQFQVGASVCGNGILEFGEACDAGSNNGACPAVCSNVCTLNTCTPPPGGGGSPMIVSIIDSTSSFNTVGVSWQVSNMPVSSCDISWSTVSLFGPFEDSITTFTELLGVYNAQITGLNADTLYYIRVMCTDMSAQTDFDVTSVQTLVAPPTALVPITITAIPEKRAVMPGGNLDTDFTVFLFDATESTLLATITATTNKSGTYTGIHEVPIQDNLVAVFKSESHLAKKIINVSITPSEATLDFSAAGTFRLIAGDVRPIHPVYAFLRDNVIEILDITYIDSDSVINTNNRVADLNRDGIVDILDLTLVDGNSDLRGDNMLAL